MENTPVYWHFLKKGRKPEDIRRLGNALDPESRKAFKRRLMAKDHVTENIQTLELLFDFI